LLLDPVAASALSLRLYRVRALHPQQAHEMWALLHETARHAGAALCAQCRRQRLRHRIEAEASIALTDGLLRSLGPRELAGVLAESRNR
jgi:heat shock protein HtpX